MNPPPIDDQTDQTHSSDPSDRLQRLAELKSAGFIVRDLKRWEGLVVGIQKALSGLMRNEPTVTALV